MFSEPTYTLPVIYDPTTKEAISDSQNIARWLDKRYPDKPRLIPEGTDAFHAAFDTAVMQTLAVKTMPLILPIACLKLLPRSEAYFRRTREASLGRLEDLSPPGPTREAHIMELRRAFACVAQWFEMDGVPKPFVMGDTVCYADLTLAAWMVTFKKVLGVDSDVWQAIRTWDDGRWERFLQAVAKYES